MKKHIREFVAFASIPLAILLMMGILALVWNLLNWPGFTEMTAMAKEAFSRYGYPVIFIGALAEGLLFANWFLPGSVVVVMGVVFAKQNGLSPFWVVNIITAGFLITAVLNYLLGRFGWYRLFLKLGLEDSIEKTKKRVERHGLKIIFSTYFHPSFGALTATSAGILRTSFPRFLWFSTIALLAWNSFWGLIVYFGGEKLLAVVNYRMLILFLFAWVAVMLGVFIYRKRQVTTLVKELP